MARREIRSDFERHSKKNAPMHTKASASRAGLLVANRIVQKEGTLKSFEHVMSAKMRDAILMGAKPHS